MGSEKAGIDRFLIDQLQGSGGNGMESGFGRDSEMVPMERRVWMKPCSPGIWPRFE